MADTPVEVQVRADQAQLDGLAGHLQATLADAGQAEVEVPPGHDLPEGGAGVRPEGTELLVRAERGEDVLDKLVGAVEAWLGQAEGCTVWLDASGDVLDLTSPMTDEQDRAAREWVARQASA